jgi:hypothetical protein
VTAETIEQWIEKHDITPYRDEEWLQRQISDHVSERAIADWCGVTEQTVKRWMRKFDIEHPGLTPASVMSSFLEERFEDTNEVSEDVQISVLWQRYQIRVQYSEIANAVGTTPSYVRKVVGAESGDLVSKITDSMEFLGSEPVPNDIANQVKSRDGGQCVRCGSTERVEMHHIIPGESTVENLAILCRQCHQEAHGDNFYSSDLAYDTRDEFWDTWVDK